jgi:hypothetical protein
MQEVVKTSRFSAAKPYSKATGSETKKNQHVFSYFPPHTPSGTLTIWRWRGYE